MIGNGAYKSAALLNPVNDARAIGELCTEAGFEVEVLGDLGRLQMLSAIESFGKRVRRAEAKQVFFFYAGHGVQLDWRNYLLPVNANVAGRDDIRSQCIDLGRLLEQFEKLHGKTFIVILDACRNDPFGRSYRPEQRGLSQFDAPPGSLLAYATAPGNVASDGDGKHGLYTENLVREFSVRGARIEDAFKRVRLNVRIKSRGAQIPWETTSLENDVYLFGNPAPVSESELEKQLEADIEAWNQVKASQRADDWADYLRRFPNGRFAEIAQMRFARLTASAPPVAVAAASVAAEIPRISNAAEYEALPAGAIYFDPDGVKRRKSP